MNIIKAERRGLGLRQNQLAKLCGVDPATIWRWEVGDIEAPQYAETILRLWGMLDANQRAEIVAWLDL